MGGDYTLNFLSFSQKKDILETISKYVFMRYKFSYLVNESVLSLFSPIRYSPRPCSPNFLRSTRIADLLCTDYGRRLAEKRKKIHVNSLLNISSYGATVTLDQKGFYRPFFHF